MKTNPCHFAAVWIAIAVVTQPLKAQVANNLVITENSPTSLSATYTLLGGTTEPVLVTMPFGPTQQIWSITVLNTLFTTDVSYVEPESSSLENFFQASGASAYTLFSDATAAGMLQPNGSTVHNVGLDGNNLLPIDLTFTDSAATSEGSSVPDTGSTFGLLFLSLIALIGASRFRLA